MSTITTFLAILAILPQTLTSPVVSRTLTSPIGPRKWGHEIDNGVLTSAWTPGFVGERPFTGPDGDYLRSTHCYCKSAYHGLPNNLKPHTNINSPEKEKRESSEEREEGGMEDEEEMEMEKRQVVSSGNRDGQSSGGGGGIQPGEILQGHFWKYEYYNYHNNATYWLNHYCMEDAFPQDKHGCGHDAPGHFQPSPDSYWHAATYNDYSFIYSPIPGHDKHSWTYYKKQTDLDWIFYGRGEQLKNQKRRLGKDQGLIVMPKEYVDRVCSTYCEEELILPMDQSVQSHAELFNDVDDMCDRCA